MTIFSSRSVVAPLLLGCLVWSGCGGIEIKPEKPAAGMPRASASTGLRAAVVSDGSSYAGDSSGWSNTFDKTAKESIAPSLPAKFAEYFRQSGAFQSVDFPAADGSGDIALALQSAITFTPDPSTTAKVVTTGLTIFLAAPLIRYTDRFDLSGTLTVKDAQNREIRRYTESYRVDMRHGMIAVAQTGTDMLQGGIDQGISGLAAKLVADVLNDLNQLKQKALAAPRPAADAPAPAASATQAGPWWKN